MLKGVIAPEQFACMTPDEMASEEVKKLKEEMLRQSILEAQVPKANLSSSNLFKCSRCGERDTTYNQVQTLSGDEPMTTFVVCNKCGKRWKVCRLKCFVVNLILSLNSLEIICE